MVDPTTTLSAGATVSATDTVSAVATIPSGFGGATHHFSMANGNEAFTVANDASIQVADDMTFLFFVRFDAPVHNRILFEHGNTTTQGWSFRTWYVDTIGHEMVCYFNGATSGNVRTTNDLLLEDVTNQWIGVVVTKSATTVRVWSTGNTPREATTTPGGTMPNGLTAPTVTWNCAGTFAPSADYAYVAQWLFAATESQVNEILESPVDLASTTLGAPPLLFNFDAGDQPGTGSIDNDGTEGATLDGTGNVNALDSDIIAGGPT